MSGRRALMLFVTITLSTVTGFAQMTSKTPLLDSRGKPLPFGVPAYHKPDVPLGTGSYKAIMSDEKGACQHTSHTILPILQGSLRRSCRFSCGRMDPASMPAIVIGNT